MFLTTVANFWLNTDVNSHIPCVSSRHRVWKSFKKVLLNYFQSAIIPSYSTEQGECFAYKFSIFHLFYDEMVHSANLRTFHKFMASSKNSVIFQVQDSLCHEVWDIWIFLHKMHFWYIYCHVSTFLSNYSLFGKLNLYFDLVSSICQLDWNNEKTQFFIFLFATEIFQNE